MNISQALQDAISHHQAGQLEEAMRLYQAILDQAPHDPDANHNLGVLLVQAGQAQVALPYLQTALEANAAESQYWLSYINALVVSNELDMAREVLEIGRRSGLQGAGADALATRLAEPASVPTEARDAQLTESAQAEQILQMFQSGQFAEAEIAAHKLTETYPRNSFGWKVLGVLLAQQGKAKDAERVLRKAAKLSPKDPDVHNNLGNLLISLGREKEAILSLRQATRLNPDFGDAHYNLGNALKKTNKLEEAVQSYRRALKINSGLAKAHGNLGNTLSDLKRYDEAEVCFQEALRLVPDDADVMNNFGSTLLELGRFKEAQPCFERVLQINPQHDQAWNSLGIVYLRGARIADAERCFKSALDINPFYHRVWNNLGSMYYEQWDTFLAIESYQKAIEIQPDYADAYNNLGAAKSSIFHYDEAVAECERALKLNPELNGAMSNLLFCVNYHPDLNGEAIYRYYRDFESRYGAPLRKAWRSHANNRMPDRRLKVGYVSPSFHRHSQRHFLEPLLAHHDHSQFDIVAYAEIRGEDAYTKRYQGYVDHWVNTRGMSDEQLAERIRQDGIDILVDVAGHTGHNRLLVFARKPAPVSLHWLDFGYTTGLKAIDYYLTDAPTVPEGSEHLFSETPWRLPVPAYAYRPDGGMGEITPLPAQQNGYISFGTLTRSVRINDHVVRVWSAILKRVPNSRLIINSGNFKDVAMQERMAERFTAQGIKRERLEIGFQSPAWQVLQQTDISLDCFPHNSGTTLFESLYMGVPFITLASRPSVGTLGASVLQGAGHPEWIAYDEDAYVEKAVSLAQDTQKLSELRSGLRAEMQQSALMDEAGFTRAVEQAYRAMWQKWCGARAE